METPEERFKALFDTYVYRVNRYVRAFSHSEYLAEEVTQELFMILWRKRGDLDQVKNMDGYVFRIARNLSIRLLKRATLDQHLAQTLYKGSVGMREDPMDREDQLAVKKLIEEAVLTLPPQPRKIYLLSRREQMNVDEMASATGLSRNTVKNHLQKALNEIRQYLVRHGYQPIVATILLKIL